MVTLTTVVLLINSLLTSISSAYPSSPSVTVKEFGPNDTSTENQLKALTPHSSWLSIHLKIRLEWVYRIALIFGGSKFSQIAALKEFVDKISRMLVVHAHGSVEATLVVVGF